MQSTRDPQRGDQVPAACRFGVGWLLVCLVLALGARPATAAPADDDDLPPPVIRRIPAPGAARTPARSGAAPPRATPPASVTPALPPVDLTGDDLDAAPPRLPPDRPTAPPAEGPGDLLFEVDADNGRLEAFEAAGDVAAYVMLGTPRLLQTATTDAKGQPVPGFELRGNLFVVWVEKDAIPGLQSLGASGGSSDARAPGGRRSTSVIPESVREIYAEGAVELKYDNMVFRADRLYLDPHRFVGLMINPRFDKLATEGDNSGALGKVPLYVRAKRAQQIGRGRIVFREGEASTSRAADRFAIGMETLLVEEVEDAEVRKEDEPHFLGYRRSNTQQYTARQIRFQAERVPFLPWPEASFGFSTQGDEEAFPTLFRGVDVGSRTNLGLYGFLKLGTPLEDAAGRFGDLEGRIGGYVDRGPALGARARWDRSPAEQGLRTRGLWEPFVILDGSGSDLSGFQAPEDLRYRSVLESRTALRDDLDLDVEWNVFSDRGFNLEYFERDELEHKDRESYARLKYDPQRPGTVVATLTGKWHQRDFVTETTMAPQAGLWVLGQPIFSSTNRGGLSLDVTSVSDAGYLGRRFDEALTTAEYDAWRVHSDTRINAAFDFGDVRLSGYVGGVADRYDGRTDGGRDLTRTALLAGARANLQMWKTYDVQGGMFELNGLRHIVDVDLEALGRFADSHTLAEVPFFDRIEGEEERGELIARTRHRFETRRTKAQGGGLRTVADLELALMRYLSDRGPYGRRSPGAFEAKLDAEVLHQVTLQGEMTIDFEDGLQTGALAYGIRRGEGVGRVNLFGGIGYIKDLSWNTSADVGWRFSEKYGIRAQVVYDFENDAETYRLVMRRFSIDHVFDFGFRIRDGEFGVELDLRPAIGGRVSNPDPVFEDAPLLNNLGTTNR